MKFFRHPLWIYFALLAVLVFANIEYQSAHAADYACDPYSSIARNTDSFTFPESKLSFLFSSEKTCGITWYCELEYSQKPHFFISGKGNCQVSEIIKNTFYKLAKIADREQQLKDGTKLQDPKSDDPFYGFAVTIANAQLAATKPPPVIWRVAPPLIGITRPVFPVTNGIRSTTTSKETVSKGELCDPLKLVSKEPISGTNSFNYYASVEGLKNQATGGLVPANRVALCVRQ